MQGVFFKAEPDVGIEFTCFFERVAFEVEDQDLAAGTQNAVGFVDRFLRVLRVVQRLAKNGEINRTIRQRDVLDVAEFISEIGEIVLGGQFGADFDHARGVVDTPDVRGAAGEELRDEAFAGTEVGDGDGRRETEREVADGFPRATGAVVAAEFAGDEVEIGFRLLAAAGEDAFEIGGVLCVVGLLGKVCC